MKFSGKSAMCVLLAAVIAVFCAGAAFADDVIGYVDSQKIMFQHPKFAQVQKQIKDMTDKKMKETKAAIDKETDDKKKGQIYQTKRRELATEESKLMEPLFNDINLAIRTVAGAKKVTVVVDKDAVFYGGTDITQDVITQIKKK